MKIFVNNKDLGFFTQEEITAQIVSPEGELLFCNHAGAVEEHQEDDFLGTPIDRYVTFCDKCEAYKREGDNYWENAPFEGVHNA